MKGNYVSLTFLFVNFLFNLLSKIDFMKALQTRVSKPTSSEKKKYVLSTDADFEILAKCKKLEKSRITDEDKDLVKFIKTQLKRNWRKDILKKLNQLLRRYK